MALFDSYRNRRQALDTLLDSFNYIEANYDSDPTNMPAVAGKILGYQYALSNAVPYLDDSDDGDRKLIDLANQFDGMVAGSNGNA